MIHGPSNVKYLWIWIASQIISFLCTRDEREQWHYSQYTVANTRENDGAFHGHEELVSVCGSKNIMTFKDMFLKISGNTCFWGSALGKTDSDDRLWQKYVWLSEWRSTKNLRGNYAHEIWNLMLFHYSSSSKSKMLQNTFTCDEKVTDTVDCNSGLHSTQRYQPQVVPTFPGRSRIRL